MAGPCTCRNLGYNPLPGGKDELAKSLPEALTKSSNTPTLSPAVFWALIPAPAPALVLFSTNKLFKQFMKAYLEFNQGPRQPLTEHKWIFKAKMLDVYYGKSHIDYYHFC